MAKVFSLYILLLYLSKIFMKTFAIHIKIKYFHTFFRFLSKYLPRLHAPLVAQAFSHILKYSLCIAK